MTDLEQLLQQLEGGIKQLVYSLLLLLVCALLATLPKLLKHVHRVPTLCEPAGHAAMYVSQSTNAADHTKRHPKELTCSC